MWNRREVLISAAVGAAAMSSTALAVQNQVHASRDTSRGTHPGRFCLNTSCIRGQKIPLADIITLMATTKDPKYSQRFPGIEPWNDEIDSYLATGQSLESLRKRLDDNGLKLESLIAFPPWGSDDAGERARALEDARKILDRVAKLGGTVIAAPAAGISRQGSRKIELDALAERYAAMLKVGQEAGVTPMLEVWGHSANLSKLSDVLYVASACGQPAPLLLDVYHLYRGGSELEGLKLVAGSMMPAFHVNDTPLSKPREELTDADRVYPGIGEADVVGVLNTIFKNGFDGALSLELFNRDLYKQPPEKVIADGLLSMIETVQKTTRGGALK